MRLRFGSYHPEILFVPCFRRGFLSLLALIFLTGCASIKNDTIPLTLRDNKCLVPIQIGSKTFTAIVDTGATHSVIDLQIAEELGLEILSDTPRLEVAGIGSYDGRLEKARIPEFSIGSLVFQDWIMVGVELELAPVWAKEKVPVIIGMDILQSAQARIDIHQGKLFFKSPYQILRLDL